MHHSQPGSLICGVCYEKYDLTPLHIPRNLPQCGHNLCTQCILKIPNVPSSNIWRCPFDNKPYNLPIKDLSHFPINLLLQSLLEENSQYETCQKHNRRVEYLCFTDRMKRCDHCLLFEADGQCRTHDINSIVALEPFFKAKSEALKESINNIEKYLEKIEGLFQDSKDQAFQDIENNLSEAPLTEEFKDQLNNAFLRMSCPFRVFLGEKSLLKTKATEKLNEYNSFMKSHDIFSLIEEDSPQIFIENLHHYLADERIQSVTRKLQEMLENLNGNINDLPQPNSFNQELQDFFTLQEDLLKCPFKINLFLPDSKLSIQFDSTLSEQTPLNLLQTSSSISHLELQILPPFQSINADPNLPFLISHLPNLQKITFDAQNLNDTPETSFISIFNLLSSSYDLTSLNFNFNGVPITDQTVFAFNNLLLSRAPNLTHLRLCMKSSKITDQGLTSLYNSISAKANHLKSLILNLTNTKITQDGLIPLMMLTMPNLEELGLYMGALRITSQGLSIFTERMLPSLSNIRWFEISFYHTKVKDSSIKKFLSEMSKTLVNAERILVNLSYTQVTDEGVRDFVENQFSRLQALKRFKFNLDGTQVSEEIKTRIIDQE